MTVCQWRLPRDRVRLVPPRCCTHHRHTIPIPEARQVPEPLRLTIITGTSTTRIVVQATPDILTALLRPSPTHSRPTYSYRIPHAHNLPICSCRRVPATSLRLQRGPKKPGKIISRIAPISPRPTPGSLAGQSVQLRRQDTAMRLIALVSHCITLPSQIGLLRPPPEHGFPTISCRPTTLSLELRPKPR